MTDEQLSLEHTPTEQDEWLNREWKYRYMERIAILCGSGEPTVEQIQLAAKEADEAVEKLRQ